MIDCIMYFFLIADICHQVLDLYSSQKTQKEDSPPPPPPPPKPSASQETGGHTPTTKKRSRVVSIYIIYTLCSLTHECLTIILDKLSVIMSRIHPHDRLVNLLMVDYGVMSKRHHSY